MATQALVTWECPKCGMLNFENQLRCIICSTMQRKPEPTANAEPLPANVWECPHCGMRNFDYQGSCIACSTPQPIELDLPRTSIPFVPLPPPEPEIDMLLDIPPDLPDLDVLVSGPADSITIMREARKTMTHKLITQIYGGDSERADRLLRGDESVSVHDVLRRAPRYGELLAAQKRWVKGAEHPLFIIDARRDLEAYVTETSHDGLTPLEGVIAKAELYRENHLISDGQPAYILYIDYEFPSPQTRKRIDGVALIPFDAMLTSTGHGVEDSAAFALIPSPGMRAVVGYRTDKVHDLL